MKLNVFVSVLEPVFRLGVALYLLKWSTIVIMMVVTGLVASMPVVPAVSQTAAKINPVPIAVIDFRGVLSKSKAAKSIRQSVEGKRDTFRTKFAEIEKKLREEQQALAQQRQIITAEAFDQRARELKERVRQAQIEAQAGNQRLKRAFDRAMNDVKKELVRIVANLAKEAGAEIVLHGSAIVITAKNLELSQQALARLNTNLPTVEVVFESTKK